MAQMVKNLTSMQETWVPSLGQEDLLEKEKATHSSLLTWRLPWTEESGGLESTGSQSQDRFKRLTFTFFTFTASHRMEAGILRGGGDGGL